jgi:glycosyltransferase involved in cell wall biosynthesis
MSPAIAVSAAEAAGTPKARKSGVQMAYLLSGYPAFSITFVLNEIQGLRALGFDIVTASINACDQSGPGAEEIILREEANTYYVKRAGAPAAVRAFAEVLFRHPMGLLRGLFYTVNLGGSFTRFFYFVEALMVGAWMRREKRSHLHVHFGGAASSVAIIMSRIFPITLSLTLHGPDEFYETNKFYLREKIEAASLVCCISHFGRSQLMFASPPAHWNKLVISRLGVDTEKFSPRGRCPGSDPLEIVCVGRLVGAKGQYILLAAFERLLRQGLNVRLRLVGKGPEREGLEAMVAERGIQEHVIFEGPAGAPRVREILNGAAIFALPSFAEGIPVALMEAMAMEIPCVSTTIAGIPELIRDGIDGMLIPPSDDVQLAEALTKLIEDPDLRRRLGASGRQRVQQHYNLEKSIQGLAEIFECRL